MWHFVEHKLVFFHCGAELYVESYFQQIEKKHHLMWWYYYTCGPYYKWDLNTMDVQKNLCQMAMQKSLIATALQESWRNWSEFRNGFKC